MKSGPVGRLEASLETLADVVASLSPDQYRTVPDDFPSSVGEQVRHCLDHLSALASGLETGRIDYDVRRRGSPVERDQTAALVMLAMISDRIKSLEPADLDGSITVVDRIDPFSEPVEMVSSIRRELAFVMSHTTHHMALVDLMVKSFGVETPEGLGFGASTLAWLDSLAGSA